MNFISTVDPSLKVSFKEAVLMGPAPGGGLFVPEEIPVLSDAVKNKFRDCGIHELAYEVLLPYVTDSMNEGELRSIIQQTFQFDIPLKSIPGNQIKVLELFHGPTWAFKDVGARFLAGCLSTWNEEDTETTILVATSGDTGGAVANGFYNQKGIRVVILYPKGKVSPLQEQQIAGQGGNITAISVNGSFDDCQSLVKNAFKDPDLRSILNLTSANSINVARWLPQMIFYAIAWKESGSMNKEITLAIPSGNYGNISSAYLLHMMGLHFNTVIAAHNANDTIPRFLKDGLYHPEATIPTLANAMDVSDPGNFVRLQYLINKVGKNKAPIFLAESVSDEQILETIRDVWNHHHYLLDPHTATAWYVLAHQSNNGIVVATAHPYKFEDVIRKALGSYPVQWKKYWNPGELESLMIEAEGQALKEILLGSFNKLKKPPQS
jgi:threonine synthase